MLTILYILSIPVLKMCMEDVPPLRLKGVAIVHNLILFSLSLYMAVETVRQAYINFGWGAGENFLCPMVEPGPEFSASGRALARVLWVHFVSKAYEFLDTWLMLGKKNYRQVSFLHVYHHATTFYPVWWAVVRYGPGGAAWLCCALNSSIHVLMYGYYLASTLGYRLSVLKPVVTLSQMVQFCVFIAQSVYLLVSDCYRPRVQPVLLGFQCTIFLILFTDFFM